MLYGRLRPDVVMLGNSITFGAQWAELLGRPAVVNRGIGGDVISGFLARLDAVIALRPRLCCVMGGINDLSQDIPVDSVFARYRLLLVRLQAEQVTPVIQSTLFVAPPWKRHAEKNPEIKRLNLLLRSYADSTGIEFLDLNFLLAPEGVMKEQYTHDGVHLTADGYRVWRDALEPLLEKHGL
jgi:lysophospholipase L1-like esterase